MACNTQCQNAQPMCVVRGRSSYTVLYPQGVDEAGESVPYTLEAGEYLLFGVKKRRTETLLLTKEVTSADLIEEGAYMLYLSPDDTAQLPLGVDLIYDVSLISGTDKLTAIYPNEFVLCDNVT